MTPWLIEPFESDVVARALAAGVISACLCAVVGTWVVLRSSVFLGDAMSHGMLPGVAVAALLGGNLIIGALVAALTMAVGVAAVGRSSKLSSDTSIGLLLVGMLAVGVVLVSRSQSFAVDLTAFLFGDVLAVRPGDLVVLAVALALTLAAVVAGHRAFVAVSFDPRKAATLGLRPNLAIPALTALLAVAIVASFHVVGTLLVLGLLVAPPASALAWATSIPRIMLLAAVIGSFAVYAGLVVSWHAGTAGGATIAAVAVLLFAVSTACAALRTRVRRTRVSSIAAAAVLVAGCGTAPPAAPPAPPSTTGVDEVVVEGARELGDPLTRLVLVDPASGDTSVYDAAEEVETRIGTYGPVSSIRGDGRFAYLQSGRGVTAVDAGAWTFDHGDHYHYFATDPALAATLDHTVADIGAGSSVVAVRTADGSVETYDRDRLGERALEPADGLMVDDPVAAAVPYGGRLIVADRAGRLSVIADGTSTALAGKCPDATWTKVSRRAAVVGCATGAVRVTGGDGDLTVTPIPLPAGAVPPTAMEHRDRADVFAGIAAGAVWVLDARQRSWTPIPVSDATATNTAGDGTVLVLRGDGTLSAFDIRTRAETARVPLFPGAVPAGGPAPVIEIDPDRAYVNNAATREVYEIDYADGLRIARTLRTEVRPGLMVEAGR